MTTTIERPAESKYLPKEIADFSKQYHDQFLKFNILINQCAELENPALRIHDFNILLQKINDFNLEVNETHTKIKLHHETTRPDLKTIEQFLNQLEDLQNPHYEFYQSKLNELFYKRIEQEILKAKDENIFDSTFYVYQDARGNETNKRQSAVQFFLGVPRKDQGQFFYVLDWLSYIGGGFLIIPLKNLLKVFIEYIPNLLATRVGIHLSKIEHQNPPPPSLDIIGNWLLYSILKPIHWVGRAITSPITSAKVGYAYGRELGNSVNSKPLGVLLGILFALPSLAMGITAVVLTILLAPPSIIWIVGKLPWVGVEGAAWLTSAGLTMGASTGFSATVTSNSLAIASRVAPSIATEASAG
ncbi:MAG TPA: hypothetical protein VHM20_08460, partial [Gammaproteobacteria bacterium]|nr:hypothetical protein [Gammaproteobacteria bacterium]